MKEIYNNIETVKLGPWSLCGCSFGPIKLYSGLRKMKFIVFKIILGFGLALTDTISGKNNFKLVVQY